jgi:purine-nucleoside phosphorylase
MTGDSDRAISESAARIAALAGLRRPRIAVLLGSGWAPLSARLCDAVAIPYAHLPAFPHIDVEGHRGVLMIGQLGGAEVALLCGRKHHYETGDAAAMKGAIRTLAAFGIGVLVQTNAAGSLDASIRPGELMLLSDHLNLVQASPLVDETGTRRFVDLRDAYDPRLREQARDAAAHHGATLHEGVYAWVAGPQFETPAEIRMLQRLGAHAVGMSTVPETILARDAGLRVLAVSLITNMGCGLDGEALSHAHTLAMAQSSAAGAVRTLEAIIGALELE